MGKFKTFLVLLCMINQIHAQEIFRNKQYGFEIQEPRNWLVANNKQLLENLEIFDMSEENLAKFIDNNKGSVLLSSFYKYDPKTHAGLIPTIQINVRNKGNVNFEQFKNMIIQSSNGFKKMFTNFEFIEVPKEIEISNIKGIYFIGKFTMKTQYGTEMKVRSRTYAIPYKNYFFQINFTDGQIVEDCDEEFEELIKTIKIGL